MGTAQSKQLDFIIIEPDQILSTGSGQTNIHKYKSTLPAPKYLIKNILVPHEAFYKFVAAMDEVIRKLPVNEPQHPEGDESPQILATQTVPGDHPYEFKLSAWRQKGYQWQFCIQADQDSKQKEQQVYLPFSVLPKLRQQMVKMQAEDDGSEPIDEMPKIPEWATRDAPNIEQQEPQPNVEQEQQMTEKNADTDDADEDDTDDEDEDDTDDEDEDDTDDEDEDEDDTDDEDSPCCSKEGMEKMLAAIEMIEQFLNEPH